MASWPRGQESCVWIAHCMAGNVCSWAEYSRVSSVSSFGSSILRVAPPEMFSEYVRVVYTCTQAQLQRKLPEKRVSQQHYFHFLHQPSLSTILISGTKQQYSSWSALHVMFCTYSVRKKPQCFLSAGQNSKSCWSHGFKQIEIFGICFILFLIF